MLHHAFISCSLNCQRLYSVFAKDHKFRMQLRDEFSLLETAALGQRKMDTFTKYRGDIQIKELHQFLKIMFNDVSNLNCPISRWSNPGNGRKPFKIRANTSRQEYQNLQL